MELGHFGKEYAGEKAIISLTSWKARINTVGLTIFNLLKTCPGFHIVLVLAEEEFPAKEAELPKQLVAMANAGLFEILWVERNWKSFKKLLPTQSKYPQLPIIIADDGILYKTNYAQVLYEEWLSNQSAIIASTTYTGYGITWGVGGAGIIFPPGVFASLYPHTLSKFVLDSNHDDAFYGVLAKKLGVAFKQSSKLNWSQIYTDTADGLHTSMQSRHLYSDSIIPQLIKEVDSVW